MKPRTKRALLLAAGLALVAGALALVLSAFNQNLVFFITPTEAATRQVPQGKVFRLGGMVEEGSVRRAGDGLTVEFRITDTAMTVPVVYRGILPDLFREGKGVVAQGRLEADGVFRAHEVLAKHDENYMPPEAAHAVKKAEQAAREAGKANAGGTPAVR